MEIETVCLNIKCVYTWSKNKLLYVQIFNLFIFPFCKKKKEDLLGTHQNNNLPIKIYQMFAIGKDGLY